MLTERPVEACRGQSAAPGWPPVIIRSGRGAVTHSGLNPLRSSQGPTRDFQSMDGKMDFDAQAE